MPDFADSQSSPPGPAEQTRQPRLRPGLEPVPVFEAAESITVEIEILKESHEELLQVIRENEWDLDEGFRTLLLTGLGYQDAKLRLGQIEDEQAKRDAAGSIHIDLLVNDLATYHSMYSVMKFKAFKLYKVNQVLDFNISGLRATEELWEGWADVMRRQQAALQAELERLRAQLSEFEIDSVSTPDGTNPASANAETESHALTADTAPMDPPSSAHDAAVESDLRPQPAQSEPTPNLSLRERVRRFFGRI
jgi:hypothetical protein